MIHDCLRFTAAKPAIVVSERIPPLLELDKATTGRKTFLTAINLQAQEQNKKTTKKTTLLDYIIESTDSTLTPQVR